MKGVAYPGRGPRGHGAVEPEPRGQTRNRRAGGGDGSPWVTRVGGVGGVVVEGSPGNRGTTVLPPPALGVSVGEGSKLLQ